MTDVATYTLPLDEAGAADAARVGGKAANLGTLCRAGLPVPGGFVITTAAFAEFVAGLDLGGPGPADAEPAQSRAARMQAQLAERPLPPTVEQAIGDAWAAAWPERPEVVLAVRSSAVAEDSAGASFAGQYESYLNVCGRAGLIAAVRACWGSLFSARAMAYRGARGPAATIAMAVVVQEQVAAECAGVLFTADPLTGRGDRVVVEAACGVGEAVVRGSVAPERTVLAKDDGRIIEQHTGEGGAAGGAAQRVLVTADLARQLGELGRRIEQVFGGPQDVEWAARDGRVYILQARPITTLATGGARITAASPAASDDGIVWSNVNVGEVLPGVLKPMTWTVIERCVLGLFAPLLKQFGVDLHATPWFRLIGGRVYANVGTFVAILRTLPGAGHMDLADVFGGAQGRGIAAAVGPTQVGWVQRVIMLGRLVRVIGWFLLQASHRHGPRLMASLQRRMAPFANMDLGALSEAQLTHFITSQLDAFFTDADLLSGAAVGMGCASLLHRCTRRWLQDEHGAIANRLLSGAGGMASAEAALDMWRLADGARSQSAVAAALAGAGGFEDVRRELDGTAAGRAFLAGWQRFMAEHGHRTHGELDVSNPRWVECPDYVLGLVRQYLACPAEAGPIVQQRRRDAARAKLLAECRARLGPVRRRVFEFVVQRAQRGLALRENFKSEAIRGLVIARRALLELGTRLAARGVLRERDDVFYLLLDELATVQQDRATFDLTATIAARRAEFARNLSLNPPPVIIGTPDERDWIATVDEDEGPRRARDGSTVADGDQAVWRGLAVSPGVAVGRARVILQPGPEAHVLPGEILIAPFTDPGWTPLFLTAAGIVMDLGGLLSHGCIVAREYGIPAVVNVGPATQAIRTGMRVEVDGNQGVVRILAPESQ